MENNFWLEKTPKILKAREEIITDAFVIYHVNSTYNNN
jgi:hypothetical protein